MSDKSNDLLELADKIGPGFAERAAALDAEDAFVAENYDVLKAHKVFSAMVPSEYGGGGASYGEMCAFVRRLAHYCGSTALSLSMHQHLLSAQIFNDRNGRPGRKVLDNVVANELVLISTGANDWLGSNGTVTKVDGGFQITASKRFCSGAPAGNVLVTSAPYDDPEEGPQVLHFPVPFSADGVSVGDDWQTMGMRATGSNTVTLQNVFVPEAAVALRRPRYDYHGVFDTVLMVAMPVIMSAYMGVAEAAADIAFKSAGKRQNDAVLPYLLGELTNELTAAQLACDSMVGLTNDFDFTPSVTLTNEILVRKTLVAGAVLRVGEKALEATSGAGFYRAAGLERLLRDLHGSQFHPLPEKRQQLFTGRLILGLPPIDMTAA